MLGPQHIPRMFEGSASKKALRIISVIQITLNTGPIAFNRIRLRGGGGGTISMGHVSSLLFSLKICRFFTFDLVFRTVEGIFIFP